MSTLLSARQSWLLINSQLYKFPNNRPVNIRPDIYRASLNQTSVELNICIPVNARGSPPVNSVSSSEPGNRFWVGGDAALGHWRGGDGLLLWVRQRREETSLGQDLHSIRECSHTSTAVLLGLFIHLIGLWVAVRLHTHFPLHAFKSVVRRKKNNSWKLQAEGWITILFPFSSQFNYMHECFERVFCELKWRKQVRTTPFLFLSGKHMTPCQVWNSKHSLLFEVSWQIQYATNTFSSGCCFMWYDSFYMCFSWCQVEEEASDKDNKNCSNNGEQRACFDILYFVLNTKQQYCWRHTKHSTTKAPVLRVSG